MAKINVNSVIEAQKEIALRVFDGSLSETEAASRLKGIEAVVDVAIHDAKGGKLPDLLAPVKQSLAGAIAKLEDKIEA